MNDYCAFYRHLSHTSCMFTICFNKGGWGINTCEWIKKTNINNTKSDG